MQQNDLRFLAKVCQMYYMDEYSQAQIAKRLGISRTSVSRAITKSKNMGYVTINLNFDFDDQFDLEKELENRYGLKEAIVVQPQEGVQAANTVAAEAASYLGRVLKSGMCLGVTWGRYLQSITDAFSHEQIRKGMRLPETDIVPMLGSVKPAYTSEDDNQIAYSSLLASKLAELIHGRAFNLPAPMYVSNAEVRRLFCEEPQISGTLEKARGADIALFGVGSLSTNSWLYMVSSEQRESMLELTEKGGVGEIIGRVYNKDGREIDCTYNDCLIGITLDDLKNIPVRIGVAFGDEKTAAIDTALKAGMISVLITDRQTAEALLELRA